MHLGVRLTRFNARTCLQPCTRWAGGLELPLIIRAPTLIDSIFRFLLEFSSPELRPRALAVASKCATLCASATAANAANVAGELLRIEIELSAAGHSRGLSLVKSVVDARTEHLTAATALLRRAQLEPNPQLIQETICCIWSTALPLLQRNLRARVQQPLELAVTALESIGGSAMHPLQCDMYVPCEPQDVATT